METDFQILISGVGMIIWSEFSYQYSIKIISNYNRHCDRRYTYIQYRYSSADIYRMNSIPMIIDR